MVRRHQAGWAQARIAEQLGVSRARVSKWIARDRAEDWAGLEDRSSRPARALLIAAARRPGARQQFTTPTKFPPLWYEWRNSWRGHNVLQELSEANVV